MEYKFNARRSFEMSITAAGAIQVRCQGECRRGAGRVKNIKKRRCSS